MAQARSSLERVVDITDSKTGDGLDFRRHLVVTFKEPHEALIENQKERNSNVNSGKGKDKVAGKFSGKKHGGHELIMIPHSSCLVSPIYLSFYFTHVQKPRK
ncbi:hypothetical protein J1N35_022829 [Gossypium stocksii]|uniref:Uncharacterized protein n=1 Tax=Gossypium stocksii TaxID=47602 RepID=A0A9D3VHD8_9ROSI|nr:hypothetical protein J1N35_022829 [Gossypium stocksii]